METNQAKFILILLLQVTVAFSRYSWIWAGGLNTTTIQPPRRETYQTFHENNFPGTSFGHCMQYLHQQHQLVIFGWLGVWIYDIHSRKWACAWKYPNSAGASSIFNSTNPYEIGPSVRSSTSCFLDPEEKSLVCCVNCQYVNFSDLLTEP